VSQPNAPAPIHDDLKSIEGAVAAMFIRYTRVLVALIPNSEEPAIIDSDVAIKQLRFRVETLAGFVVGAAVRAAGRAGRGRCEEPDDRAGLLLGRVAGDGRPAVAASEIVLPALRARAPGGAPADPGAPPRRPIPAGHVSIVHAEETRTALARLPDFTSALDHLAAFDVPALAFFDQLSSRWQHYTATVGDLRFARGSELTRKDLERRPWRWWMRRLRKRGVPVRPIQDEVLAKTRPLRAPRTASNAQRRS